MLENLLEFHEKPEDTAFVAEVMQGIKRQQRIRRLILTATGVVGAAFGTAGAIMLSAPIAQALGEIRLFPVSVAVLGGLAFIAWIFQDEVSTGA